MKKIITILLALLVTVSMASQDFEDWDKEALQNLY
jgi:uncharacterized protein YxeA